MWQGWLVLPQPHCGSRWVLRQGPCSEGTVPSLPGISSAHPNTCWAANGFSGTRAGRSGLCRQLGIPRATGQCSCRGWGQVAVSTMGPPLHWGGQQPFPGRLLPLGCTVPAVGDPGASWRLVLMPSPWHRAAGAAAGVLRAAPLGNVTGMHSCATAEKPPKGPRWAGSDLVQHVRPLWHAGHWHPVVQCPHLPPLPPSSASGTWGSCCPM